MIASSATQVISAIVTPAILILSCSSLITATASRQSKLLERVRDLTKDVEAGSATEEKRVFVASQLLKGTTRTRLVQRALLCLYVSLGGLILTSVMVGIGVVAEIAGPKIVIASIFISLSFLFYASLLLIRESRIALTAINAEMDYIKKLVR